MFKLGELHSVSLCFAVKSSYLKAYRDMASRRTVQHTASAPWKESSRARAADSTVDDEVTQQSDVDALSGSTRPCTRTGRGGVQEYTSIIHIFFDIRSTSSSVCKGGALVSPSSCLDGEPHGWVLVDTHSTPVPQYNWGGCGWPTYCMSPMYHRNTRNPYRYIAKS